MRHLGMAEDPPSADEVSVTEWLALRKKQRAKDREPPSREPFADYCARIRASRPQLPLVATCSFGPIQRHVPFELSTTDELRRIVMPIGVDVGREQLLALCHNRYPCGYWVETEADKF